MEPSFNQRSFQTDPSESSADPTCGPREEIDELRDSVRNEPWMTEAGGRPAFSQWLERRRGDVTTGGNLWFTLLAALAGGPFAVVGAFMADQAGMLQIVYIIVFGPIVEELLKQSGMIYLLERKPYRLFSKCQFLFAGALSALIFATLENLLYIYVYSEGHNVANPEAFARFRWTVCTAVHVGCSTITSLGLVRVWRKAVDTGEPADLSFGFPLFAAAIAAHGAYNLSAFFFSNFF